MIWCLVSSSFGHHHEVAKFTHPKIKFEATFTVVVLQGLTF